MVQSFLIECPFSLTRNFRGIISSLTGHKKIFQMGTLFHHTPPSMAALCYRLFIPLTNQIHEPYWFLRCRGRFSVVYDILVSQHPTNYASIIRTMKLVANSSPFIVVENLHYSFISGTTSSQTYFHNYKIFVLKKVLAYCADKTAST